MTVMTVMTVRRRVLAVCAAVGTGVCLGLLKGDSAGLRGAVGNLSAPWLLIGLVAGHRSTSLRRGVAGGLAATGLALLGFYLALTAVLGGQLGDGGVLQHLSKEVGANRIWFVLGLVSDPVMGATGWALRQRPHWLTAAVGALLAGELLVVAAVRGRQLLPGPLYLSWGVDDWRAYAVECAVGTVVTVVGLLRMSGGRAR